MVDNTPWLDDEEKLIWRSFIEVSGRVTSQLNDSLKQQVGLTMDDYEVLVHLTASDDERLRMSELSRLVVQSQSRLTQRIDRLVKKGLVCREKCPNDRRGTFACLTPTGRAAIDAAAPMHLHDVRRTLIDLIEPGERQVLAQVLERVALAARNADGH